MVKLVGITGGTGSGKTTFVRKIADGMPKKDVVTISQDSYYKDLSHIPLHRRRDTNFDHPDAFEWDLLLTQVQALMNGNAIDVPIYDYATSSRLEKTIHIEPAKVIILEGIMVFHNEALRNMMDLRIFLDASDDERLLRVIKRDTAERDLCLDDLMVKYRNRIKPMHNCFIEPMKQYAHIIMSTEHDTSCAVDIIRNYIKSLL